MSQILYLVTTMCIGTLVCQREWFVIDCTLQNETPPKGLTFVYALGSANMKTMTHVAGVATANYLRRLESLQICGDMCSRSTERYIEARASLNVSAS